jgi:hypothetical protein
MNLQNSRMGKGHQAVPIPIGGMGTLRSAHPTFFTVSPEKDKSINPGPRRTRARCSGWTIWPLWRNAAPRWCRKARNAPPPCNPWGCAPWLPKGEAGPLIRSIGGRCPASLRLCCCSTSMNRENTTPAPPALWLVRLAGIAGRGRRGGLAASPLPWLERLRPGSGNRAGTAVGRP